MAIVARKLSFVTITITVDPAAAVDSGVAEYRVDSSDTTALLVTLEFSVSPGELEVSRQNRVSASLFGNVELSYVNFIIYL